MQCCPWRCSNLKFRGNGQHVERSREPGDPQVKPEMTEGLGAHPQTLGLADFYPISKLDSIFKTRDITLPTNVRLVKVFPVVMYGYESWTVKKAEC